MRGFGIGRSMMLASAAMRMFTGNVRNLLQPLTSTFVQDVTISTKGRTRGRRRVQSSSWHKTTWHPENGKRECDRRMRQIAAGQLTVANGLIS